MNYRISAVTLTLLCITGICSAEEVYKTTDKYGNVIYSDNPNTARQEETTEKVEVRPTNIMPASEPDRTQRLSPRRDEKKQGIGHPDYNVTIVSPAHESTVPPGQRDLIIAAAADHPLQKGAQFAYYMDGELLGHETVNNYSIREIIRGAHTLEVKVESAEGEVLSSSEPVTVYVHRASVQ